MARPKVPPDKRQRTAIACDSCKRKKQKCDGRQPCSNCTRRSLACTYGLSDGESGSSHSANKRRMLESPRKPSQRWKDTQRSTSISERQGRTTSLSIDIGPGASEDSRAWEISSRGTDSLSGEEEAVMDDSSRMLQDPAGRLLYIGDAASLSFLQLVRIIVESTEGVSPFTLDPRRHRITENTQSLPNNARTTQLLPPKETAFVLLDSFFDHTCGLVEVVNRSAFMKEVENCYSDPHAVDPSWLSLLYLFFATGLVFATPIPGTKEDLVIQKLRSEPLDRAEIFYCNSKNLGDPSAFENPDLWSIQTLLIMTLYMLAVAKRNRAYALHGMAVRSAFALGLHREETMVIFSPDEQTLRRNLWRSLFVLDRFLSVSLGRPTSISEDDCSDALLNIEGMIPPAATLESQGLWACVRSCHLIGLVLEKVYAKRKISTKLGQELADRCKSWPKTLDTRLHWDQAGPVSPNQGIAILHIHLFYYHSIILLSRPFFLSVLRMVEQERIKGHIPSPRRSGNMERFSEACLTASCHSIVLVQRAMEARFLSNRNPFVAYFLFSAALIVLCNEFAIIHPNPGAEICIDNALKSMNFMARADAQTQRLHYILKCFHDVVINRRRKTEMLPSSLIHTSPVIPTTGDETQIPGTPHGEGVSPHEQLHPAPVPSQQQALPPPIDTTQTLSDPTAGNLQTLDSIKSPDTLFDFQSFSFGSMSTDQDRDQEASDLNDPTEIEFEALWNWPRGTQSTDPLDQVNGTSQGVLDSAVPLYSTEFMGLGDFQNDGQFMF